MQTVRLRGPALALVACCAAAAAGPQAATPPPPIHHIGSAKQLFVDHRFIEEQTGITLRVNPPRKAGIALKPEMPWEEHLVGGFGAVLEDQGLYKMWYCAVPCPTEKLPETLTCPRCQQPNPLDEVYRRVYRCRQCGDYLPRSFPQIHMGFRRDEVRTWACYAVSRDGVHWERPRLGLVDFRGSRENNLIQGVPVQSAYEFQPFRDPKGMPQPRYYAIAHKVVDRPDQPNSTYLLRSADGLSWDEVAGSALPFGLGSHLLWDDRLGKYVAYLRGVAPGPRPGDYGHAPRGRTVVRCEMDDLLQMPWPYTPSREKPKPDAIYHSVNITTELPIVMAGEAQDPPDTDVYNPCVWKYPYAQDVYLAFPGVFRHYPGPGAASAGREHHRYFRGLNNGPLEAQLSVSRDGVRWSPRRPYLALGLRGSPDAGFARPFLGVLRRGDKLYQYYESYPVPHGSGEFRDVRVRALGTIGRLEQDLDRFIAAEAEREGRLVTPLLRFSGKRLQLNIDCGGTGEARVALLDAKGTPFAGYGLSDCDPIDLNDLRHPVSWHGKADVSAFAGQPIRLVIVLRAARLYAFQFVEG